MTRAALWLAAGLAAAAAARAPLQAQAAGPAAPAWPALRAAPGTILDSLGYDSTSVMIPMRDGVRLHTRLLVPRDRRPDLPVILLRTPYGVGAAQGNLRSYLRELAEEGYVFAFQDIRGRYRSEGTFVMARPLRRPDDPSGVDESTDAHDTIDWLVTRLPTNGRVGILGISYPGWLAAMAAIAPHPALRATSPQAPMVDLWLGDDFFHNGAFRQTFGVEYAARMELSRDQSVVPPVPGLDTYDWYLRLGTLGRVEPELFRGRVPTWRDFVAHPAYDTFWVARALQRQYTVPTVPTLVVGGWWDQEDLFGPLELYRVLEASDARGWNHLVMGPWNHGGWAGGDGRTLGPIDFGSATGAWFRREVQAPWFRHWLKDGPAPDLPEALVFEGGTNRWRRLDRWPDAPGARRERLHLREGRALAWAPAPVRGAAAWVSDPSHPVPYRPRPIEMTYDPAGSRWRDWLVQDQRFVHGRPDVLVFETPPLERDVTIAGAIEAVLQASTTGDDADWVVKLIDVHPDSVPGARHLGGFQLMVASEILRGRYRDSWSAPSPMPRGRRVRVRVPLREQAYTFRAGHRIMVQVQGTWFPLYDRNPQRWVPNLFAARPEDFHAATHRVHWGPGADSYVELPVVAR